VNTNRGHPQARNAPRCGLLKGGESRGREGVPNPGRSPVGAGRREVKASAKRAELARTIHIRGVEQVM